MFSEPILPPDYPDFEEFGETPCSQSDPDIFFSTDLPEGNRKFNSVYLNERQAKEICSACPYKLRCLEYSIKNPDLQGIWGATTEKERRKLIRRGRVDFWLQDSKKS